ncbi:MAG: alpha/beta hydrolase [Methanomethylophilus sp.]|nr:alpha/beta hydrolase [Methanomethylophilus sp.]
MTYASVNGAKVWYELHGKSGIPVVLLTGLGGTTGFWDRALPLLADRCQVLILDNRGAGRTEYRGDFTIADLTDDTAAIMDLLGLFSAHILGWSMGSHIALDFAARYPLRTRSLTLVSSYRHRPARAAYVLNWLAEAYSKGTVPPEAVGRTLNVLLHPEGYFRGMEVMGRTPRLPVLPTAEGMGRQLRAIDGMDVTGEARSLKVPVLSVHGTEDIMVEPKEGDALAALIPDCEKLRIPGEGHVIRPENYMPAFQQFALRHQR